LLLSKRMPLHRLRRDDDSPDSNRMQRPRSVTDNSPGQEADAVQHKACRKTHSRDSPSDRHETPLSDSLRQSAYYGQQAADLLSEALSAPTLWRRPVRHRYHPHKDHAPANTNSYNSSARAE